VVSNSATPARNSNAPNYARLYFLAGELHQGATWARGADDPDPRFPGVIMGTQPTGDEARGIWELKVLRSFRYPQIHSQLSVDQS